LGSPKTTMITTNHNGGVAIEFAIILPLLLLVTFGVIELGLLLFNQQIITNAAREGARAGIVSRHDRFADEDGDVVDDLVEAVVNNWLAEHLVTFGDPIEPDVDIEIFDCTDPTIDCKGDPGTGSFHEVGYTWVNPCRDFECPLRITVTYNYEFLVLSIPLRFFGFGPRTLVARSVMRME